MNRFMSGLITGGLVGGLGISYFLKDKKNRSRMMRDSRKMMKKGKVFLNDISDNF